MSGRSHRFIAPVSGDSEDSNFLRVPEDQALDDRVDVLLHLKGVVPHLFLFGRQTGDIPRWAVHVLDWAAVPSAISRTGS